MYSTYPHSVNIIQHFHRRASSFCASRWKVAAHSRTSWRNGIQNCRASMYPSCSSVKLYWQMSSDYHRHSLLTQTILDKFLTYFLRIHTHAHTGTKSDLHATISSAEAERVRRQLNANAYLECSAKQFANINEVIYAAVRAVGDGVPVPEEPGAGSCWNSFLDWFRC